MAASEALSEVLSDFARTMLTDFPIQGILDQLVKRIVEILPITAAGVTVIAPGLRPHYVAASNAPALRFHFSSGDPYADDPNVQLRWRHRSRSIHGNWSHNDGGSPFRSEIDRLRD